MRVQRTPRYWAMQILRGILGDAGWMDLAMRRRRFFYKRAGVCFIHIPKAAGSSISSALYGRRLGHVRYQELQCYAPEVLAIMPVFSVIRDPASRVVSAYRYVKSVGTNEGGLYDRSVYHEAIFDTFESFFFEWLPYVRLHEQDYLFQTQESFLKNTSGIVDAENIRLFTLEGGMSKMSAFVSKYTRAEIARRNTNRSPANSEEVKGIIASKEGQRVMRRCYGDDIDLYHRISVSERC